MDEPVFFDLKTVNFLRETLDDAWACLGPEQRAGTNRSEMAEHILKAAAKGERDKERLLDAALSKIAGLSRHHTMPASPSSSSTCRQMPELSWEFPNRKPGAKIAPGSSSYQTSIVSRKRDAT